MRSADSVFRCLLNVRRRRLGTPPEVVVENVDPEACVCAPPNVGLGSVAVGDVGVDLRCCRRCSVVAGGCAG